MPISLYEVAEPEETIQLAVTYSTPAPRQLSAAAKLPHQLAVTELGEGELPEPARHPVATPSAIPLPPSPSSSPSALPPLPFPLPFSFATSSPEPKLESSYPFRDTGNSATTNENHRGLEGFQLPFYNTTSAAFAMRYRAAPAPKPTPSGKASNRPPAANQM